MTDATPRTIDLTDPAAFAYWTRDTVRFSDVDHYRHINNVAMAAYCETGRVAFAEAVAPGSTAGEHAGWVIANLSIDFRAQAHYPGEVNIGTRVERLGRSSCAFGQGLFKDGTCFATAQSVMVWLDFADGGQVIPLPKPLASRLRAEAERPQLTAGG